MDGAVILPPMLSCYHKPESIGGMPHHVACMALWGVSKTGGSYCASKIGLEIIETIGNRKYIAEKTI